MSTNHLSTSAEGKFHTNQEVELLNKREPLKLNICCPQDPVEQPIDFTRPWIIYRQQGFAHGVSL